MADEIGNLKPPAIPKQPSLQQELTGLYIQMRTTILAHVSKALDQGKRPFVIFADKHDSNGSLALAAMGADVFGRIGQTVPNIGNMGLETSPGELERSLGNNNDPYRGHFDVMARVSRYFNLKQTAMDIPVPDQIKQTYNAALKGDKAALSEYNEWQDATMDLRETNMNNSLFGVAGGGVYIGALHSKAISEVLEKDNASVMTIFLGQKPYDPSKSSLVNIERAKFLADDNKVQNMKFSDQVENIPIDKVLDEVARAIEAAYQQKPPEKSPAK